MKKYIFLVEDIVNDRPVTLTEKIYSPVLSRNRTENIVIPNFDESAILLNSDLYKTITFVSAKDFIKEVGYGELSPDYEVYYFINVVHSLQTFHFMNLLGLEIEVINFLHKHKIPIIIDSSMEITHPLDLVTTGIFTKLFDRGGDITSSDQFYRGLERLTYIIVHPMLRPIFEKCNYTIPFENIKNVMFPTPFFYLRPRLQDKLINYREDLFNSIKNKVITENTCQWVAYSYTERLNRMLFFMRVHLENLVEGKGKYSLLLPLKDKFMNLYKQKYEYQWGQPWKEVSWITEEVLNKLDEIKTIDLINEQIKKVYDEIIPRNKVEDIMYNIVLETFDYRTPEDENLSTHTMLTEKTAKPIVEGLPFLTFGGKELTKMLEYYGFILYKDLNFESHNNLHKELDQIISKMKYIDSLSLEEKNKLNNEWKEIIMYNYDHYLKLNVGDLYISSLKGHYKTVFN